LHERLRPVGALQLAQGLKVGAAAPVIEVRPIDDRQALRIGAARGDARGTLVMFVSPTCPVCKSLLPALRAIRRSEQSQVTVILASDGARLEHLEFIASESLEEFPYVLSEQLGIAYGVSRLPYAVLIDQHGIVRATGLVNTREQLDSLFEAQEQGVANVQEFAAREQQPASREVA
jgi:methylamine dehydrogenase accessory protein MauD